MTIHHALPWTSFLIILSAPLAAQSSRPLKPPLTVSAADTARFIAMGRTYTRWLLSGVDDSLAAAVEPPTLKKMGGARGIASLRARLVKQAGTEQRVVEEKLTRRNGELQYWRAATYSALAGEQLVIRWVMNPAGRIIGAGFGPRSQAKAD